MSFNATSSLLCVSSATDTIHVFRLGAPPHSHDEAEKSGNSGSSRERHSSSSPGGGDSRSDFATSVSIGSDTIAMQTDRKHNGTFMGIIRRTSQNVGTTFASSVGAYLPSAVSEMWEPTRDFAWMKIPKAPPSEQGGILSSTTALRSVVAISSNTPQVMVVTNEGHFYVFGIDLEKGGEGTLLKVYEVGAENDRLGASMMDE